MQSNASCLANRVKMYSCTGLFADKCILNVQVCHDYNLNVSKSMRDFFVKDDPDDEDQKYDPDEVEAARQLMWQDIKSVG